MNTLYAIMGKSGSGKTCIAEEAGRRMDMKVARSYTDRPQRGTEDIGHHFLTEEEFDKLEGKILETVFSGHRYTMTQQMLDESDIVILDVPGVKELRRDYKGKKKIVVIGIYCDDEVLREHMKTRGDAETKISEREIHDKEAFREMDSVCDLMITNNRRFEEAMQALLLTIHNLEEANDVKILPV